MHYRITVSYDGTKYFGWQKTMFGPSVQSELELAASFVLDEKIQCEAASRTDRGVHARGQVVQLCSTGSRPPERLLAGMNARLPDDIRVIEVVEVEETFHPTLGAVAKTYTYQFCTDIVQNPFFRKFSWHYPHAIDPGAIRAAAEKLVGTHDFSAFTTEPKPDNTRTVFRIELIEASPWKLVLTADRFLYKMARTLAGTLAYVGSGKLPVESIDQLLKTPDRTLAGMTAPPHGLCLERVYYKLPLEV